MCSIIKHDRLLLLLLNEEEAMFVVVTILSAIIPDMRGKKKYVVSFTNS